MYIKKNTHNAYMLTIACTFSLFACERMKFVKLIKCY